MVSLAAKVSQPNGPISTTRLFNAALSMIDDEGRSRPYLAEALPQLNTPSWRVFPDGRMETTYTLRDNLTWHDGTPLTAEDFAFAYRVYKDPNLGPFNRTPQNQMDAVLAPDPRTRDRAMGIAEPNGGSLTFEDLDPLPSHLIESSFSDYSEGRTVARGFYERSCLGR